MTYNEITDSQHFTETVSLIGIEFLITKLIIQQMGGNIQINSNNHDGTELKINLKIK